MLRPEDLDVRSYPESKGGQHVGVPCGVRVEHLPTGTVAAVNLTRSQHKNRSIAIEMIEWALASE